MLEHSLMQDDRCLLWLADRPEYCNRGRYKAILECAVKEIHVSGNDWWPRYYFNLEYAKEELVEWLRRHQVPVAGARWVTRRYDVGAGRYDDVAESQPVV